MTNPDAYTEKAPLAYSADTVPPIVEYPATGEHPHHHRHVPWPLAGALSQCLILIGAVTFLAVTYQHQGHAALQPASSPTVTLPAPPAVTVSITPVPTATIAAPPPAATPLDPDDKFLTSLHRIGWGILDQDTTVRVGAQQCEYLDAHPGASIADIAAHLRTTVDGFKFTPDQAQTFVELAVEAYCPNPGNHASHKQA